MDQEDINKFEGRTRFYNIGNRISGLAAITLGAIFTTADNTFLDIVGYFYMAEGFGDLMTGKHHYFISRIFGFHLRYK